MPVEIRELIIKTEIRTEDVYRTSLNNIDLNLFKNEQNFRRPVYFND